MHKARISATAGFSLLELLTYVAILSIMSTGVWRAIEWVQQRETHIDHWQQITATADYGLQDLNQTIARALFPPKIVAISAAGPFRNTHCLEVTQRTNTGATAVRSFWLGLDATTLHYSLYKTTGLCSDLPDGALKPLTPALFVKKDSDQAFFISAQDGIRFNFKVAVQKGAKNYEIQYHQATATAGFVKLAGTRGCKISTASNWFSGVTEAKKRLKVQISGDGNRDLDRLKYRMSGVSKLCAAPATPTVLSSTALGEPYVIFYTEKNFTNNGGRSATAFKWRGVKPTANGGTNLERNSSAGYCDMFNWNAGNINDQVSSFEVGPPGTVMTLYQHCWGGGYYAQFGNVGTVGRYVLPYIATNGVTIRDNDTSSFTLSAGPGTSTLTCSFDAAQGVLEFVSTTPISAPDWARMVADIEYAPATATSSASLKGGQRTLTFSLGNDGASYVNQGNMTLDLYRLSRACGDANFSP